jgi:hypothetical protein
MKKIAELTYKGIDIYEGGNKVGKTLVNTFNFTAHDAINAYGDHLRYNDRLSGLLVIKGLGTDEGAEKLKLSIYGPKSANFEGKTVAKAMEKLGFENDSKLVQVGKYLKFNIADPAYNVIDKFMSGADILAERKVRPVKFGKIESEALYEQVKHEIPVEPILLTKVKKYGPMITVKKTVGDLVDMAKLTGKADAYLDKLNKNVSKQESEVSGQKPYVQEISQLDLAVLRNMDWNGNSTEMVQPEDLDFGNGIITSDEKETDSVKAENPLENRI